MTFNSFNFLLFCIVFFPLFFAFKKKRILILVIAGTVFYGAWDYRYLGLMYFTICSDYTIAKWLYNSKNKLVRNILFVIGLFLNLGLLCLFKYYDFFAESSNRAFQFFNIPALLPVLNVILPVGISFYTLHSVGYLIDVYKKDQKPVFLFQEYAAFITFFPLLIAGPILRIHQLRKQLENSHTFNIKNLKEGLSIFFVGFFQKVAIADNLAFYADNFFNNSESYSYFNAIIGIYSFAFQIYGDFAGYSNMAIGLALVMGYHIPKNFNLPYFAVGLRDFWRRWHISLSKFFRDFLYIPLGGNKAHRTTINLVITMSVCGLWHGAHLNMLLWGLFHGILLSIEHLLFKVKIYDIKINRITNLLAMITTFHIVCIGWILFRAENVNFIKDAILGLLRKSPASVENITVYWPAIALILCAITIDFLVFKLKKIDFFNQQSGFCKTISICVLLLILIFTGGFKSSQFIYFQF